MNNYTLITSDICIKKKILACSIATILGSTISIQANASLTCSSDSSELRTCTGDSGLYNPNPSIDLNAWDNVEIKVNNENGYGGNHAIQLWRANPNTITSNLILRAKNQDSDGLNLMGSNANLTGKVLIETQGDRGAGIFLSNKGISSLNIGDNLEILSSNGMGIAAEIVSASEGSSGLINNVIVGDNAKIKTTGDGYNGDLLISKLGNRGTGYGIYSGAYYYLDNARSSEQFTHSALVKLGHNALIETSGNNAHGVYANKTGLIESGDLTVLTLGNSASGIVAEDGITKMPPSGSPVQPLMSSLWPSNPVGTNEFRERVFDGGRIYLTRDVNVRVNGTDSYAFYSTGKNAYIGSGYMDGPISEGVYTVYGDMLANRQGEIDLRMIQGSKFSGAANSTQLDSFGQLNTTDNGYINLDIKGKDSLWDMTSSSVITNMTLNDANITWRAPTSDDNFTPAYLTVVDNFSGNNGTLTLNTVLGDDNSQTDQMHILGNVEPGTTKVSINNIGGKGALTNEGIEIITVGGQSFGTFVKASRIVAGAYDYDIVRKGEDWYLTSSITKPVDPKPDPGTDPKPDPGTDPKPDPGTDPKPDPGTDPKPDPGTDPKPDPGTDPKPDPGTNPKPEPGTDPKPVPEPNKPLVRPEPGAYLANHAAANNLFVMRLHDRLGETQYTDALTGEKKVTSLWLRQVGGHNVFHSAGQLTTQSNRYIVQLGSDVAEWSSDGKDRWHLGVMGGYANNQSNTRSRWSDYKADGTVSGYSVGVYGTWYADNENKEGLYTDSWLIYSWFNSHVSGNQLASESYKSRGVTASVESGWTKEMGTFYGSQGTLNTWYVQPKAQAIWMGVRSDSHREQNGTNVSFGGDGNIQTRLGMRAYINSHHKMDEGKRREFEPFVEMNWLHNTRTFSATLDDRTITQEGSRNIGEIKTGVEAKIGDRLNMWGNVAVQVGGSGYHDASAMYGIKYQF
jgi:outer membrane autotransporter barrel domain